MTEREELLQRATELVPVLRQRAAHAEELRHIPQGRPARHGVVTATQPVRFGGLGHDASLVLRLAAELGRPPVHAVRQPGDNR